MPAQACTRIAIHGVPRSGTTWIGEIVNSSPNTVYRYQPLFSYAHKDFLGTTSSAAEIDAFYQRLLACSDSFTNQTGKRADGELPVFLKQQITHIAYKEVRYHHILGNLMQHADDLKLVAIIRNPLSVIHSWLKAPREFRQDLGWNIQEEWRHAPKKNLERPEEFNGFEKWKQAAGIFNALASEHPGRVFIAGYSRFLQDPVGQTRALFAFLGLEYGPQTAAFLGASNTTASTDPYSVYRSGQRDDAWKSGLPAGIIAAIESDLRDSALAHWLD